MSHQEMLYWPSRTSNDYYAIFTDGDDKPKEIIHLGSFIFNSYAADALHTLCLRRFSEGKIDKSVELVMSVGQYKQKKPNLPLDWVAQRFMYR